jgi:hypothetical protein
MNPETVLQVMLLGLKIIDRVIDDMPKERRV